jgi:hypothetical protein
VLFGVGKKHGEQKRRIVWAAFFGVTLSHEGRDHENTITVRTISQLSCAVDNYVNVRGISLPRPT